MVPYFPQRISYRAIIVYLISLAIVSIMYFRYAMSWGYILLGAAFVSGFFLLSNQWTVNWGSLSQKRFERNIFLAAVLFRLVWVVASYFYYLSATGTPFEFDAMDSFGYHDSGLWLSTSPLSEGFEAFFGPDSVGVSDAGYALYLGLLYRIFGPVIIIPRIIKAFISAFTCILIYHLAVRLFDEKTGRIAAIMCVLMPNLIIYCGYHLKETEMLFLEVAFLERTDYLIRTKRVTFGTLILPTLLAGSLFLFRTVLGATAIFSFATAILFSSAPTMKKNLRRLAFAGWGILMMLVLSGGTIMTEAEGYWEAKSENLSNRRMEQTMRGNRWAQYATGAVMAPMVFVLPFSTMVDVDEQYGQQEKHGGNFIRNFMGFFAILGIYEAIRRKQWRDFSLIGSFVILYLGIVSLSAFSNSERFLLPGLPCLILIWSYGIATLRKQTFRFLTPWSIVVVLMEVAWAYFKLGSRGLF